MSSPRVWTGPIILAEKRWAAVSSLVPLEADQDRIVDREHTLAGSFGLTLKQAREILASVGDDRTAAAHTG